MSKEGSSMSVIIKAHFDGNTIVPDTKIDLPSGQALEVELRVLGPAASKPQSSMAVTEGVDITSYPFFGMWADRKDMMDSAVWVREEREKWNSRLSDTD
jgi:hypothetical protein